MTLLPWLPFFFCFVYLSQQKKMKKTKTNNFKLVFNPLLIQEQTTSRTVHFDQRSSWKMEELHDTNTEASEVFTPLKVTLGFKIHNDGSISDEENESLTKIPHGLTAKKERRKSYHHGAFSQEEAFQLTPKRVPLTAPRSTILNSIPISSAEGTKRQLFNEMLSSNENDENLFTKKAEIDSPIVGHKRRSSVFGKDGNSSVLSKFQKVDDSYLPEEKSQAIEDTVTLNQYKQSAIEEAVDDDFILVSQDNISIESIGEASKHSTPVKVTEQVPEESQEFKQRDDDPFNDLVTEDSAGNFPYSEEHREDVEEKEELSRIEIDEKDLIPAVEAGRGPEGFPQIDSFLEESAQETKPAGSDVSVQTPLRLTESVALSPKAEQNSRIIDEAHLLLDKSNSSDLDDNFVAESPLSRNVSVLENDLELDDDLEMIVQPTEKQDVPVVAVPPNQRPLFTINQVHAIQADFRKEVSKLEESVKEKRSVILTLNDNINQDKNEIIKLKDEISSLELARFDFSKEKELLHQENEQYENDIKELRESLGTTEEKLIRSNHAVEKFKARINELDTTIISKDSKIVDLTEDIDSKLRAIETLNARVLDFEEQASRLSLHLTEKLKELAESNEEKIQLEGKLLELKQEIQSKNTDISSLLSKEDHLKSLIDQLNQQVTEQTTHNDENDALVVQLDNEKEHLMEELNAVQMRYQSLQSENQSYNFEALQDRLNTTSKDLLLKKAIVKGLTSGVATLKSSNESLSSELKQLKESFQKANQELDETKELLVIRKAEVDELIIENKTYREESARLTLLHHDNYREINDLKELIQDREEQIQSQSLKVQELDSLLQKQESDHLTELEAFHSEMSNVQSMVSNKSNELYELKEQVKTLNKDNDLLKYEIESFKEDAMNSEQRINDLKNKLNSSKNSNESLESQIAELIKEKTVLEAETEKRLQQLAEDLYIQYSKKHEQKVQVLKKGYENKWSSKVMKFENENTKLKREIEGLNSQLEQERAEKAEIIKLWDSFKNRESGQFE